MIKLVIFDMDGVLVDTEKHHAKAFQNVLSDFGITITDKLYHNYFGQSDRNSFDEVLITRKIKDYKVDDCVQKKRQEFLSHLDEITLFDGAENILIELAKSYKLALASNSSKIEVDKIITSKDIKKFFCFVVTRSDIHKSKPDPQIYELTARRMDAKPEESVVIEDSLAGIRAAKDADMKVIAVTFTEPRKRLLSADFVVDKLSEIPDIIKKL